MVIGTRKANATKHPGDLLAVSKQQRRTRAQIEEDEARAKAVAVAAKESTVAEHRAIINHVVDIEESMGRNEGVIRAHANRPDLQVRNPSKYPVTASRRITDLE